MAGTPLAAGAGTLRLGDFEVRRIGFGAMRVTGAGVWGPPKDRAAAIRVLRRAVELGVNLIDTADSYGPNVSEELIAEALHPYPADLLIATKGGLTRGGPDDWRRDCRPEHLKAACEGSLKRLRVERLDLYQLHAIDSRVPYEESVGALAELQAQGKVRHIGISNVNTELLSRARALVTVVSVQNRYNLGDRQADPVIDACEREGLGFLPWYPLAAGPLTREDGAVARVAKRLGAKPSQVALAWLLARSRSMLPIPGTSSVAHLEENVAAAGLALTPEDLRELG